MGAESRLKNCLSNLDMFDVLKGAHFKFDLHMYWCLLEQNSSAKGDAKHTSLAIDAYTASLAAFKDNQQQQQQQQQHMASYAEKSEDVATFLVSTDRYE